MSKFWSGIVHEIEPYVPGEQPQDKKYIKLNTNENPYPPSPKVSDALAEQINDRLRLYPDPTSGSLTQELSAYFGVKKERVFIGNGSDEVLAFAFLAFFSDKKPILFPDITYSFYPVYCKLYKIGYDLVSLDESLAIPVDGFRHENGGIIFPNPNAPTGRYLEIEEIKRILEDNRDQVVIIDEAYVDFGGDSAIKLIDAYPNLLVIQTFSKSRSLAGLRIGFAIGNEELVEALNRIKNSFNSYTLDRMAMAAAVEAIRDEEYFKETCKSVIETRERVAQQLEQLGFNVIPSKANFLFISHEKFAAQSLYEKLKEEGILVRYFNKPRINNYLRVTIGTDKEMSTFIGALKTLGV
jgi:histidinol-phosphate aminotransferase